MREECSVVSINNKQFCSVRLVSEVSNIFHEEPMNPTTQAVCELIIFSASHTTPLTEVSFNVEAIRARFKEIFECPFLL